MTRASVDVKRTSGKREKSLNMFRENCRSLETATPFLPTETSQEICFLDLRTTRLDGETFLGACVPQGVRRWTVSLFLIAACNQLSNCTITSVATGLRRAESRGFDFDIEENGVAVSTFPHGLCV